MFTSFQVFACDLESCSLLFLNSICLDLRICFVICIVTDSNSFPFLSCFVNFLFFILFYFIYLLVKFDILNTWFLFSTWSKNQYRWLSSKTSSPTSLKLPFEEKFLSQQPQTSGLLLSSISVLSFILILLSSHKPDGSYFHIFVYLGKILLSLCFFIFYLCTSSTWDY